MIPPGTVGIVGVGSMGGAMALRLLDAGYGVVANDIDGARTELVAAAGESGPGALFTVRFAAAPASALHQPATFRDGHQQAQAQA